LQARTLAYSGWASLRAEAWQLTLLVAAALALTLYGYQGLGYIDTDGVVYYGSATTDIAVAKWILAGKSYGLAEYLRDHHVYIHSNYYAKPLWHLLNVAALLIFGDHDYSIPVFNGLMAALTVALFYLIARRMLPRLPALAAALFLLLSPLFLWHGRTDMAHMPQLFFLLAGAYFYLKDLEGEGSRWTLPAAGAFFGLAAITHASTVIFLGVFGLFEIYRLAARQLSGGQFLKRGLLLALPVAANVLWINYLTAGFMHLMGPDALRLYGGGDYGYQTYFQQIAFNAIATHRYSSSTVLGDSTAHTRQLQVLETYFYNLYINDGALRLAVMAAGWLALVWNWRRIGPRAVLIAALVAIPYAILVWGPLNPDLRLLLPAYPFAALAVGWAATFLLGGYPRARLATIAGMVLVLGLSFLNALPLYQAHSGFKEVAEYLRERGVREVCYLDTRVQVPSFLEAYGIKVDMVPRWQELSAPGKAPLTIISYRDSFFNPAQSAANVAFSRAAIAGARSDLREAYVPPLHAMDMERRRHSPIMDWLFTSLLGRNITRRPFPIFLFQTKELQEFSRTWTASGGH